VVFGDFQYGGTLMGFAYGPSEPFQVTLGYPLEPTSTGGTVFTYVGSTGFSDYCGRLTVGAGHVVVPV